MELIFIINSDILTRGKRILGEAKNSEINKNDLYMFDLLRNIENVKTFLITDEQYYWKENVFNCLIDFHIRTDERLEFLSVPYERRKEFVIKNKNSESIIVYIGNSIFDIPAMKESDLKCTTNQSSFLIADNVDFASPFENNGLADCIFYALFKYLNEIPIELIEKYLDKKKKMSEY